VHGDQVVGSDELVQLDVVHVTGLAGEGGVQHQEHVIRIHVHLRYLITLHTVADGKWMKAEDVRQHAFRIVVPGRDVHPDHAVGAREQTG